MYGASREDELPVGEDEWVGRMDGCQLPIRSGWVTH